MNTNQGRDNVNASAESIACSCYARLVTIVVGGRNTHSFLLCDEYGEPSSNFRTIPDPGPFNGHGLTRVIWCDTHNKYVYYHLDFQKDRPGTLYLIGTGNVDCCPDCDVSQ